MHLTAIPITGDTEIGGLPHVALDVIQATVFMYGKVGYQPPWLGYLGIEDGRCVGTCAFKSPPVDGRVEIAFFTFSGNEGRGVATRMVQGLIDIAVCNSPDVRVYAQTLPKEGAATKILTKTGFHMTGEFDHPEDGRVWEWELFRSNP